MNLTILSKNYRFFAIIIRDEVFSQEINSFGECGGGWFCAVEFFLQRKCRFSERSRRQIFRNRKHVIVLKCHASCRTIFIKKMEQKTHLANAEIGNRKYIQQMRKYRSPIGKVVSCIKFLLFPTGVKSNKIKGEENQINQESAFHQIQN